MRTFVRELLLDLRGTAGRSLLSALGLILAVLAIISIYVTGSISQQVIVATSEQKYGRFPTVAGTVTPQTPTFVSITATLDEITKYLRYSGTAYAVEATAGGVESTRPGDDLLASPPTLTLLAGSLNQIRRLPILDGRWLSTDAQVFPGGVVENVAAESELGGVGSLIRIVPDSEGGAYYERIVGVIADGSSEASVYASLTSTLIAAPAILAGQPLELELHSRTISATQLETQMTSLGATLGPEAAALGPQEVDQIAQVRGEVKSVERGYLLVAAIALLVAAVGLVSIGLSGIVERTRELTIRRALGARRSRIFGLVMCSALVTGILAAAVAVCLGIIVVAAVVPGFLNPTLELARPAFPWSAAVIGLVSSTVAAALGALAPAIRASRLEVAAVLRE